MALIIALQERGEMYMFKNNVFKVSVNTKDWIKAAGIRAIKTMAQTTLAGITVGATLQATDWSLIISTAAVAGIASILTSIAGIPEVKDKG